ncbi:MAG: prepilin-type N-terminal cleavage/methylation domain-containing protein [Sulfuriferula multivorans]|uniref:Prepilin-type N-terminal cleavage/methylation domain-containing protein n=1 Tax=Sulfuriferula multivorans TaxID=1559896 RepID=A0A7C9TAN6_9PROT|nr:prepilin-type N-terminal cleavage/methylation domain-containing protein [Sulfuriferula multivorans]
MTSQRGFTLIEMAIVLVIITILIGGLAVPLSAQIQARRIAETNKTLEEAREAIIGYAMTHKTTTGNKPYLPCPDTNGDGIEETRTAHKCPQQIGFLPWVTLGAGAQDAWGNRLLYATNTDVSNDDPGFGNSVIPVPSWNQICSSHTCTTAIAADVPVVLVSHGSNGWGALNVNGNTLAAPSGQNEQENQDGDNRFVSRIPAKPGDPNGEFDDLLVWIPYYIIFPRVCPTGCL